MPKGKNDGKSDLRMFLAQALLELMRKTPFPSLSVKDLTHKAGVSRDFFYERIKSKEALVSYYLGAICECFEPPNPLSYKDWLEQFMAHLQGYADALLELHKNGLTYLLHAHIKSRFCRNFLSPKTTNRLPLEMEHKILLYADAFYELLYLWFDHGMNHNPKEIINATRIGDIENNAVNNAGCLVWCGLPNA